MREKEVFVSWLKDAGEALLGSLESLAEAYQTFREAYRTVRPADLSTVLDLGEATWNAQNEKLEFPLHFPPYEVLEVYLGGWREHLVAKGKSLPAQRVFWDILFEPSGRDKAVISLLNFLPREPKVVHEVVASFEALARWFREGEIRLWTYGARLVEEEQKEYAEALRERALAREIKGL